MSYLGVFDLFKIGVGLSSSHAVNPMIAVHRFADHVRCAPFRHWPSRGMDAPYVSLDDVIRNMMLIGVDMKTQYTEASRVGLAVNAIEC